MMGQIHMIAITIISLILRVQSQAIIDLCSKNQSLPTFSEHLSVAITNVTSICLSKSSLSIAVNSFSMNDSQINVHEIMVAMMRNIFDYRTYGMFSTPALNTTSCDNSSNILFGGDPINAISFLQFTWNPVTNDVMNIPDLKLVFFVRKTYNGSELVATSVRIPLCNSARALFISSFIALIVFLNSFNI